MEHALVVRRPHLVYAGFKEGDQRRIFLRQADLAGLTEDGIAVAITPQRLQQREGIGNRRAVVLLPIEQREGQWQHQRADEVERERRPDRTVQAAAGRWPQQLQQVAPFVGPKHRRDPGRRRCP